MEDIQAFQIREESTAQQIVARDELNEPLNNPVTSLRQQTLAEL